MHPGRPDPSESQSGQGCFNVDICRDANLLPTFCIGRTGCLGLTSELDCVTAQKEMCRQAIAGSQTKDDLSQPHRIVSLLSPMRLSGILLPWAALHFRCQL